MSLQPTISKRCDRCERHFQIPNIRTSPARDLMIEFFPCAHCGYVKDILFPKNKNHSGRCLDCCVPFAIIDHQAKGFCNRCYMRRLRTTPQNQAR